VRWGLLFTAGAKFTGLAGEEAAVVGTVYTAVDVRGLLLAGIVIGSLGVLDDVTVTQAATVAELSKANPTSRAARWYRAAARVGREHVASTVNTLVLAYAGASLPLLLLFSAGGRSVGDLVTNEAVAQEIVRSAVGSIGIVAAVPITTALAVRAHRRAAAQRDPRCQRGGPGGAAAPPRVGAGKGHAGARGAFSGAGPVAAYGRSAVRSAQAVRAAQASDPDAVGAQPPPSG
jgi:hypothetical protein